MIRAVGVETGGSNVQFARQPRDRRDRRDRDEPARLALVGAGLEGDRLPDREDRRHASPSATRSTRSPTTSPGRRPAAFEPTIDYVVTKIPRFAFEKFPGSEGRLTTHMKSRRRGDGDRAHLPRVVREGDALARARLRARPAGGRRASSSTGSRARRRTASTSCSRASAAASRSTRSTGGPRSTSGSCASCGPWRSDGDGTDGPRADLQVGRHLRRRVRGRDALLLLDPRARGRSGRGPISAGEVRRGEQPSVVILGSGPNRIGQGIEFDYCCVHAAMTVRESGRDAVMVNCNPETVSTDYDTSDRLYFEPLTADDVLAVIAEEQPEGVIVQFGGQTPLRLAKTLEDAGVRLLGTPVDAIDLAEDRGRFGAMLERLGIAHPPYGTALSAAEAEVIAAEVGFPLLVRPSYVLGGRAMEICYSTDDLTAYLTKHAKAEPRAPAAARPLPRGRDRGRRRRSLRRGRLRARRGHAARRGGRCPLGRLGLRPAADEPRRGDARPDRRDDPRAGPGARRDRADQHPVRRRRRRALRDRGQPARLPHRSLRQQGDRRADRQDRLPPDARRGAGRPGRAGDADRSRLGQGGRACPSRDSPAPTACSGRR